MHPDGSAIVAVRRWLEDSPEDLNTAGLRSLGLVDASTPRTGRTGGCREREVLDCGLAFRRG
jgi:hypothetical protein